MKRRKKSTRQDPSRLGQIFAELGFKNPNRIPLPDEPVPQPNPMAPPPKGPCGKSLFPSERKCRDAIKRLRNGKGDTSFLRPFPCQICHGWHMTSLKSFRKP